MFSKDALISRYNAFISVSSGSVVALADWVSNSSYKVLASPSNDPTEGFSVIENPEIAEASPLGWQNDGKMKYNDTRGNNAQAQENRGRFIKKVRKIKILRIYFFSDSSDKELPPQWRGWSFQLRIRCGKRPD